MTVYAQTPGAFTGKYPETKTVDQVDDFFGTKVSDPYRWLENDTSDETKDWVQTRKCSDQCIYDANTFSRCYKKTFTELWNYEKFSAPFKEGELHILL